MIGFAVLMFGMNIMSESVEPLKNVPEFTNLFVIFGKNPILSIVVGCILTAIIQSSSASVGILQALSATGGSHSAVRYRESWVSISAHA